MPVFICPVCGCGLERETGGYVCRNGHRYDCAREGYVNLLPGGKNRSHAGDSAGMMAARTAFLNGGFYAPLRDALSRLALAQLQKAGPSPLLADAGCGEGYYTAGAAEYLRAQGLDARVSGVDLSRRGVRAAARRAPSAEFAVASIFRMPYAGGGVDVLFCVFAPLCAGEFRRVLRAGGMLFAVTPGREHLMGLKRVLYDAPYENEETPLRLPGFEEAGETRLRYTVTVEGANVQNLFAMTPYYWKTPPAFAARLRGVEKLETPVSFCIAALKKTRAEGPEPDAAGKEEGAHGSGTGNLGRAGQADEMAGETAAAAGGAARAGGEI